MEKNIVDQRGQKIDHIKDYETDGFIRTWSIHIPEETITELKKTLDSTWINTGKKEKEFRQKVCDQFGAKNAVACNSGTSALKAALLALGVGYGDEVVSTPFTFIATNTSILEVGAKPVFADIVYDTLNINPKSIREKITEKTKAIIVVHYGGLPCEMDEIREIGKEFNIPIIEDSAHAMGSKYKNVNIGAKGDIITFSFQVVKIVTCGDGGIICTPNDDYYKKLKEIVWYGVDRETKIADPLDPLPKDLTKLGYKMNMNDITATIGCVAMDHLSEQIEKRTMVGERYRKELQNLKKLTLLNYPDYVTPNYQIFPVHIENRDEFAKFMFNNGIQVNVNNRRNDRYTLFGGQCNNCDCKVECEKNNLPITNKCDQDVILLPCHGDLSNNDVTKIIETIKKFDEL
jgi:perosamine synthetase